MGKYYGLGGKRIGKIGNERYYIDKNNNIVQSRTGYRPINSSWLNKGEFKNYVINLLNEKIPQIYVLNELPEELYEYGLLFVKNGDNYKIYVDKERIRTEINIVGEGGEVENDGVDVVNELPIEKKNNCIYFVRNNNEELKKENKNKDIKANEDNNYKIYVYEDDKLKPIDIKIKSEDIEVEEGEEGDIMMIKEGVSSWCKVESKSLYNHCYKVVWHDYNAYPTPYCEIEFITNESTPMSYEDICNWLTERGFTTREKAYPKVHGIQNTSSGYVASTSGGSPTVSKSIASVAHGIYYNESLFLVFNYGSTTYINKVGATNNYVLMHSNTYKITDFSLIGVNKRSDRIYKIRRLGSSSSINDFSYEDRVLLDTNGYSFYLPDSIISCTELEFYNSLKSEDEPNIVKLEFIYEDGSKMLSNLELQYKDNNEINKPIFTGVHSCYKNNKWSYYLYRIEYDIELGGHWTYSPSIDLYNSESIITEITRKNVIKIRLISSNDYIKDELINAQNNINDTNKWEILNEYDQTVNLINMLSALDSNTQMKQLYEVMFCDKNGGVLYLNRSNKLLGSDHTIYIGNMWKQSKFYKGALIFSNGKYVWTGMLEY